MLLHVYAGDRVCWWHLWLHQWSFYFTFSPAQMSVLTEETNRNLCLAQGIQTLPGLRVLPSSQLFCSLWSCNYIFLNAVLLTVVVQRSFKEGNCACAMVRVWSECVSWEEKNVSYLFPLSLLTSLFWGLVSTLRTRCCKMNLMKIIEIVLEASWWFVSLVNENI